ncbi:helix-turn-helix transcriptional regulator [Shewanella khirikhana]|uniref:PAS fold protein n=1 Tax=Shewanella khirikhana TaxID=1965282 RepID=A0ABM7DXK0_9GAMM|nr:PAS domain-containing protein [Shewanella khirikhana]AZQ13316.1 PAS fold protein [Shewanella khirikhana]
MKRTFEHFQQSPIIATHHALLAVKDLSHQYIAASYGYADYAGQPVEQLIGLTDEDLLWQEQAADVIAHDLAVLCGDTSVRLFRFEHPNNSRRTFLLRYTVALPNNAGQLAGTHTLLLPLSDDELEQLTAPRLMHQVANLSKKEFVILSMLMNGVSRKAILEQENISISTYDTHLQRLKKKFRVSTTHELIIEVARRDLFPFPDTIYP